jgi:D-psicose/D-tagatose/L-ribulose 3-epimerase
VGIIPGGLSLASSDSAIRRRASDHVRASITATRDAGARLLSGPLYTPVGHLTGVRRTADEWRWAVDSWQQLAPVADAAGVEIGIEPLNRFETYFLNTAADAARFCDEVGHPSVGLLFDTFHANIEEKSIGAAVRTASRHLKHLHTCENDRDPGSAMSNGGVLRAVPMGYDRWLTIESFGFARRDVAARRSGAIWPPRPTRSRSGVKFPRPGPLK